MRDLLLRRRNLLMKKQEELNIRAVCFKADGEQTVAITKVGSAPDITMQYSYDGVNWNAWDLSALTFGGSTKVYVRGVGNTNFGRSGSAYNQFTFSTDSYVYVSGIAESLLDGDNEVLTYLSGYTLARLFYQQTALRSAEDLRFEATGSNGFTCNYTYAYMFASCTNLLYAPKALSIESFIVGHECAYMFSGCTSLLTAPTLPATKLSKRCYANMFDSCTSLVNAPELPATTLQSYCYEYMFQNCTSLKTIRCRAKVTASSATSSWMFGVKTVGTFYGHSEYGWATGESGIPTTWTFEELTD